MRLRQDTLGSSCDTDVFPYMEEVRREGPRASRTMVPSGALTGHEVASRPVSRTGISLFQIDARILQLVIDQVLSVTRSIRHSRDRPDSGTKLGSANQWHRRASGLPEGNRHHRALSEETRVRAVPRWGMSA